MATLDDLRDAGYDIALAWEGWDDVSAVYRVSYMGESDNPDEPSLAISAYLADTPDAIGEFLDGRNAMREEAGR